jgi:hypothetical protein
MNIELGTQIIGSWGAMVPESYGHISSMNETAQGTDIDILWSHGSVYHATLADVRADYASEENFGRIGLFVNPFTEELK